MQKKGRHDNRTREQRKAQKGCSRKGLLSSEDDPFGGIASAMKSDARLSPESVEVCVTSPRTLTDTHTEVRM
jgi:hypothetical protein